MYAHVCTGLLIYTCLSNVRELDLLKLWKSKWKTFLNDLLYEFSTNVGSLHAILWEERKWLQLAGLCQMGVETDAVDSQALLMERYHPKRPWAERVTHHKSEGTSELYIDNKHQAPGGNMVSNQCHYSTTNPIWKTHWLLRQHSVNLPATNHFTQQCSVHQK